jgi:hypothetical protein
MSTCKACGVAITCPGGCGVFCLSGGEETVAWCEPAEVSLQSDREPLDGSAIVSLCAKELNPTNLHNALQTCLATPLRWAIDSGPEENFDLEFSGTVDQLLERIGLRRGEPVWSLATSP